MADSEALHATVGVAVVNWNSFDVLYRCLAALAKQTYPIARIVVIDNNSANAPDALECEIPRETVYVRLASNSGFAAGNNLAASYLRDCDYIALINPDAFPNPDWLEKLVSAARRNPSFSCFSSMTVIADEPDYLDGTGDVYHISGIAWRRGYERHIASSVLVEEEVFAPCAAAAMYTREAWNEVGGFDEDYFCYFEDVDLAFRMRLLGHRCLFVPTAVAHHVGSVTSGGQQSDFSVYYGHRNLVWTYIKNMPGIAFWVNLPLHVVMNLVTVAWFAFAGRSVIFRAKWDAIKGIRRNWAKRQVIQAKRKASVRQILGAMDKRVVPVRRPGKTLVGKRGGVPSTASNVLSKTRHRVTEDAAYFNYLKRRTALGLVYRTLWLYPKIQHYLVGRVLDIGCGIGDFLAYRPGTVGVDVNVYAVEWCIKKGLDARLMQTDQLPFDENKFESIVLDNVLEHIADPIVLLREIRRVLTNDGRLIVGVPGLRGYECDPDHKVFYNETALDELMNNNGFTKIDMFFAPFQSQWLDKGLSQYCLYAIYVRRES